MNGRCRLPGGPPNSWRPWWTTTRGCWWGRWPNRVSQAAGVRRRCNPPLPPWLYRRAPWVANGRSWLREVARSVSALAGGTVSQFSAYGPSHWAVLAVTVAGAAGLVVLGRHGPAWLAQRCSQLLAIVILLLNVSLQLWTLRPAQIAYSLPLQLSDLAPYASAYALWSGRRWAFSLTYYWGITLSTQALLTPVLNAPDFPGVEFLAFFAIHVLVVWAAIFLTWGLGMRPSWSSYWFTVAVTACWAAAMLVLNAIIGTNYGFLSAKPSTGSILDLLGPWPWYLIPEVALILGVWALMTAPWRGRKPTTAT